MKCFMSISTSHVESHDFLLTEECGLESPRTTLTSEIKIFLVFRRKSHSSLLYLQGRSDNNYLSILIFVKLHHVENIRHTVNFVQFDWEISNLLKHKIILNKQNITLKFLRYE